MSAQHVRYTMSISSSESGESNDSRLSWLDDASMDIFDKPSMKYERISELIDLAPSIDMQRAQHESCIIYKPARKPDLQDDVASLQSSDSELRDEFPEALDLDINLSFSFRGELSARRFKNRFMSFSGSPKSSRRELVEGLFSSREKSAYFADPKSIGSDANEIKDDSEVF